MKRFYFSLFLGLTSLGLSAQTTTNTAAKTDTAKSKTTYTIQLPADLKYQLPDGSIIPPAKFDSARASWGGKQFGMKHEEGGSIYQVFFLTDADFKESADARLKQATMLNQPAPDFTLKTVGGETINLSQLKGKVIVLNFWFTSCAPCREEMPSLNKIKSEFDQKGVVFLGLPLDDAGRVAKFLTTTAFNYVQLPEAGKVHAAYKISSCPTSMVINKNGIISFIQVTGQEINSTLPVAIQAALNSL